MTSPAPAALKTRIVIVNETVQAALSAQAVAEMTSAIKLQAAEFARAWGITGVTVSHETPAEAKARAAAGDVDTVIVLLDDSDQAGALGYHSEQAGGVTYGRVFALTCQQNNVTVSSCLSHEVLEAIADLNVDRWADDDAGKSWALEVCDPVESDSYPLDGVEVSNYVLPSFFDAQSGEEHFDRLGKLTAPFTLGKGGYAVVEADGKTSQIFGDADYYEQVSGWRHATKADPLARTAHRLRGRVHRDG